MEFIPTGPALRSIGQSGMSSPDTQRQGITYGEIARLCGLMRRARFVGQALRNLPPNSNVPWHRVINSQGTISFPRQQARYRRQKKLLEKEGILFIREKIDLAKYGWPHAKSTSTGSWFSSPENYEDSLNVPHSFRIL